MASQQDPTGVVFTFEPATPSPTPTPAAAMVPASGAKACTPTCDIFERGDTRLRNTFKGAVAPAVRKALEQCVLATHHPAAHLHADPPPKLGRTEQDKFNKARQAGRASVELHVDNCKVREENWSWKTLAERVRWLVARYDEKMQIRVSTATSCVRHAFPARYDRVLDLMWLVPRYAAYLKEPEKEKAFKEGAAFQIQGMGDSDDDDDEEMEDGEEIIVKSEESEDEDSSSEDEDGDSHLVEAKAEVSGESDKSQKRKGHDSKKEGGPTKKKRKADSREETAGVQHAMRNGGVAAASDEKVVYVAVSRRMIVEERKEVTSDSSAGCPWANAGKTGPFGGGKGVQQQV